MHAFDSFIYVSSKQYFRNDPVLTDKLITKSVISKLFFSFLNTRSLTNTGFCH